MNTMVVHALDTSVRVLVQTRTQMQRPMSGNIQDKHDISALLKREVGLAIADPLSSPNNMYDFIKKISGLSGLTKTLRFPLMTTYRLLKCKKCNFLSL